jgi:hypothetical protein
MPTIGAAVVFVDHLLVKLAVQAVAGQDHAPRAGAAEVAVADAEAVAAIHLK